MDVVKLTLKDGSTRKLSADSFWSAFNHPFVSAEAIRPEGEGYARALNTAHIDSANGESTLFAWTLREESRDVTGIAAKIIDALGDRYKADTYLHMSETDPSQVAYTKNLFDGIADKQTRCAPGRYLKAVYGLADEEIGRILAEVSTVSREVKTVTDKASINEIFETRMGAEGSGCSSCMYGKFRSWRDRPYHIYADHEDLCVLAQYEEGTPVARTVAFRSDKKYVRVYATNSNNATRMHADLATLGWTRLKENRDVEVEAIRHNGTLLCPYTDWTGTVTTYDGYELETDNTDGYGESNGSTCSDCECRIGEDEGPRCESCQESYSCCDRCDSEEHNDNIQRVDRDYCWCERCAQRFASACDRCSEAVTETTRVGDHTWCNGCVEDRATTCDDCHEMFDCDDLTDGFCENCKSAEEGEEPTAEEPTADEPTADTLTIGEHTVRILARAGVLIVTRAPWAGNSYRITHEPTKLSTGLDFNMLDAATAALAKLASLPNWDQVTAENAYQRTDIRDMVRAIREGREVCAA